MNIKVGDMVGLSYNVTRKGRPEEDWVGLVVEVREGVTPRKIPLAVVNFCGVMRKYPVSHLRVIT